MKQKLRITVTLLALLGMLAFPGTVAQADIAPPPAPPGSNISPPDGTQVQMVSEEVIYDIQPDTRTVNMGVLSYPVEVSWAKVEATFTMHNLGTESEHMDVRFPLKLSFIDETSAFQEIFDLKVQVNSEAVQTGYLIAPFHYKKSGIDFTADTPWATFPMTFYPGEDVHIDLTYSINSTGWGYNPLTNFDYVLSTGAGWKGPIGSVKLRARFPYPVSDENFMRAASSAGAMISANEVQWGYRDLEPTTENDWHFTIRVPWRWAEVLKNRKAVMDTPNDGAAWGKLGDALTNTVVEAKPYINYPEDSYPLIEEGIKAYRQAIALSSDPQHWHLQYAYLCEDYLDSVQLGSQDPTYLTCKKEMDDNHLGNWGVPLETPTSTLPATPTETITSRPIVMPSNTPSLAPLKPSNTPTLVAVEQSTFTPIPPVSITVTEEQSKPTPTSAPQAGGTSPLCSAIVIPFLLVAFGLIRQFIRSR
jgi:hypothetical protein